MERDVLVHVFPVDADAASDEPPVPALRGGRVSKAWKPFQRHRYYPTIGKGDVELVTGKTDIGNQDIHELIISQKVPSL